MQPLTPGIAAGTGASAGVVVTWVDPQGPASGQLAVTDVIDQVDGIVIATPDHWRARVARLSEGESVLLRARRGDEVREVRITAGAVVGPVERAAALGSRCGQSPASAPQSCGSIAIRRRGTPASRPETC